MAVEICVAGGLGLWAQAPAPRGRAAGGARPVASQGPSGKVVSTPASAQTVAGGRLHGVVRSGKIPLPGVTVIAENTLTGKRYSTTSDITGSWSMTIPENGRYVIRTQFAAFAAGDKEAVLNATSHDQTVDFDLILASRAAAQEQQQARQAAAQGGEAQAIRQLNGNGAENLDLMNALSANTDTGAGSVGQSGAALPSIAGNSDFSDESVAVSGQSGQVSPMAGVDMEQLRSAMEQMRAQNGGRGGPGGAIGLFGGGFRGGGGPMMGGPGGFGGGRFRNFRGFNPGQPHGAIFWMGSNSAINAEPYALRGQPQQQPASGMNRFGLTLMTAPYIPRLTKPSTKDSIFLTISGTRSSSPSDLYGLVPTDAERAGDFSGAGQPAIYDPTTLQQFVTGGIANVIPASRIAPQATALLNYFPKPNLSNGATNNLYNYHLLTTAQSNTTQAGLRYMRSLGANAGQPFGGRFGGFRGRGSQNQGLHQSINFNFNWAHSAADNINIFPQLGGKTATNNYSLQAGYVVGYHRLTSISNVNWNRSDSQRINFFTNGPDVATQLGILGPGNVALNPSPLNYGLPGVTLSNITGLSEQQPNFLLMQTISASETVSWMHGKHNMRFGGDYRRVHRDFLGSSNATGRFTFTGLFTEDAAGNQKTGSPLADFLLGLPQETTIDSAESKSYLRDNVIDAFAQDDWRMLPTFTLMYGIRYEYFAPYTEKYGHLAVVDTNPAQGFTGHTEVEAGGVGPFSGSLPDGLVFPFRKAFSPRVGFAWRVPRLKQTVIRGGYGVNYTVGQYATFATTMAHEPPFANEQTNEEIDASNNATSACARGTTASCFTLAQGFPAPATTGNYALEPHYQLPYVQSWNLDIQRTLPRGLLLNIGYNGSRGSHLDITSAPRATPDSPATDPGNLIFNYDQAAAYSRFNAGTVRLNKRLSSGIAMGAYYQYSHSIDNAGSVGGTSTVVAQNWQDLAAEEGNSSFDQRHKVSGNYLFEMPFGQDKRWVTSGVGSHILEGFSVSGDFVFATGTPLTPSYQAAVNDVARGTAGTLRPDRVPGTSITAGGGSVHRWFNTAAFAAPPPAALYGTSPRNCIPGPGTVQNNMSLSKTMQLGDTSSMELRATSTNVFNTVQYAGVDATVATPTFGQVQSVHSMRMFNFMARFRF